MIDVDGLSRWFGVAMAQHLFIAALLHRIDISNQPNAYNFSISQTKNVARLDPSSGHQDAHILLLTVHAIVSTANNSLPVSVSTITTISAPIVAPIVSPLCSVPILSCHSPPVR